MLRSYRGVLAAIAGLILCAGAAPKPNRENRSEQQQTQSEPTQRGPSILAQPSTTLSETPEAVQEALLTSPCEKGQERRQSDLCAQWKAADAAQNAAVWAMIGTIVASIGTVGLFWQIHLTRKAVEDTGEATAAMREANKIAREASHRQTRAYVFAKSMTLDLSALNADRYQLMMEIQNVGQTPAVIDNIFINVHWLNDGTPTRVLEHEGTGDFKCNPGSPTFIPFSIASEFDGSSTNGALLVTGRIEYTDVFKKKFKEVFSFHPSGDRMPLTDYDLPVRLAWFPLASFLRSSKNQEPPENERK